MTGSIFLSYSSKDLDAARSLRDQLRQAGHSVWFDRDNLLPGQNIENEIRTAINEAKAVLICLSSNWVNDRGFVQKELKLAVEVMKEMPEGTIYTIPVRFDACKLPPSLNGLLWVDIFEPDGMERLQNALQPHLSATPGADNKAESRKISAYSEFMEEVIARGDLLHVDSWELAHSQEELDFKALLRHRWKASLDLVDAERHQDIIDLWAPLEGLDYFRVDHTEWSDKPFFRCQIQAAKAHLFIAHVQLGVRGDYQKHMPRAFALLGEFVEANPYSMKGGAADRLSTEDAEIQNLNYSQMLEFALDWFRTWGRVLLLTCGISETEYKRLQKRVNERMTEIAYLLKLRDSAK